MKTSTIGVVVVDGEGAGAADRRSGVQPGSGGCIVGGRSAMKPPLTPLLDRLDGVEARLPFEIPLAIRDDGRLVLPTQATKLGREYSCPTCHADVSLRRSVRRPHFAHVDERVSCAGAGESEHHKQAKLRVAERALRTGEVAFVVPCACGSARVSLPISGIADARLEHVLGARRIDVALFDRAGDVLALVEIKHTHSVDITKAAEIDALAWFELDAESVVGTDDWLLLRSNTTEGVRCSACEQAAKAPVIVPPEPLRLRRGDDCKWRFVRCPTRNINPVDVASVCCGCAFRVAETAEHVLCSAPRTAWFIR